MIEKMLNELADGFCPTDAEQFDSVYADFEKNASVSPDVQSRILSSVMRKAGLDMKETVTVKKTRKHSKRFVGFAIAAAMLATGAIGAGASYAFSQFANKESVEHFLGDKATDKLESIGLALNMVRENEHVRITADTALSDGQFAYVIFTLEKLDDTARTLVKDHPYTTFDYAGWNIGPFHAASCSCSDPGNNDPLADSFTFMVIIPPYRTDFSWRDIRITFGDSEDRSAQLYKGIKFDLDLSKNVDTLELRANKETEYEEDEETNKIILSPFGLSGRFLLPTVGNGWGFDNDTFMLIKADGTREPMVRHEITFFSFSDHPFIYICVRDFFDLNDYIGVEIDGVEYLKQ